MKKYILGLMILFGLFTSSGKVLAIDLKKQFSLYYVEDALLQSGCKSTGSIDGCFVKRGKKIYVNNVTKRPKDFVVYHEIGHALLDKDFYAGKLDKTFEHSHEVVAETFAVWIYEAKYNSLFSGTITNPLNDARNPAFIGRGYNLETGFANRYFFKNIFDTQTGMLNKYYNAPLAASSFINSKPTAEQEKIFEEKCDTICKNEILSIKIPGIGYPLVPFVPRVTLIETAKNS